MYMAFSAVIRVEKIGQETSPTVSTWPVQLIFVTKKFGRGTSPIAVTWPGKPINVTKNVGPETSSTAYRPTLFVQPIHLKIIVGPEASPNACI
jgi:hypothetical protein